MQTCDTRNLFFLAQVIDTCLPITNMADTAVTPTLTSRAPCPVTKLPPELREMIYQYYFKGMEMKLSPLFEDWRRTIFESELPRQISDFDILKPYFSMLHLSSRVRSETAPHIYKKVFTDAWFNFDIDGMFSDVKYMKDMFTCCRSINKDVKFGLQFTVTDHDRGVFLEFVDSFFNIHTTGDALSPVFVRCDRHKETRRLIESSTSESKIEYTYRSERNAYHRLWMFVPLEGLIGADSSSK